ncbi:MAG: hypothetical protein LBG88_01515 [Christensenellaceae bacterium]|jgi:hypothetical protein|nr:hypothetical protein [Christensenellaceae bacterium]
MLDKRTTRFLSAVAKICDDGSYKIIEKAELLKEMHFRGMDFVALEQMVRYLKDNEMVDLKYSDENVFCLTVLPKGRVAFESMRRKTRDLVKVPNKTLIIIVTAVFLASLLGSMLGAIFAKLM